MDSRPITPDKIKLNFILKVTRGMMNEQPNSMLYAYCYVMDFLMFSMYMF